MTTLIICPHRDDEAISCGGLIQARVADGHHVHVLSLYGRVYNHGAVTEAATDSDEAQDMLIAQKMLRYQHLHLHNLREGEPHQVGYYRVLEIIETLMDEYMFHEIVIPGHNDLNQDHRHLHHVCQIALRAVNLKSVRKILEFIALDAYVQEPNYFVPLTKVMLRTKIEAVNSYRRERRTGNSPRSPQNIEAQARVWGAMSNRELAEGFILKKEID